MAVSMDGIGQLITRRIVAWLCTERPPTRDFPLCDFDRIRYELRPCDVLLVDGRTRGSDVIKMITLSPWSHAALYLGRLHDIEDEEVHARVAQFVGADCKEQLIIESELGLGAVVRPLSVYRHDHLRICRPRGLAMSDSQKVVAHAVGNLGKTYDVRHILDLARFLLPWSLLPRRWRSSLFANAAGEQTKTICSTMIAEAFDSVEFPILPLVKRTESGVPHLYRRNPKLCTPSDFDYSPHFEIIKYPFWDLTSRDGHYLSPIVRSSTVRLATDTTALAPAEDGIYLPAAEARAELVAAAADAEPTAQPEEPASVAAVAVQDPALAGAAAADLALLEPSEADGEGTLPCSEDAKSKS
jgi:hypothetical protein